MYTPEHYDETRRICRDCRNTFTLDEKTQNWFHQRDMQLPKRCTDCRKARRIIGGERAECEVA